MKAAIFIPALAGLIGFVGSRIVGINNGLSQLGIGIVCMILGATLFLLKKRRG